MGIFDSLLGNTSADAAAAAAQDTYRKQKQAAEGIMSYGNTLPGAYNQLSTAYDPYTQGGQAAYAQLLGGLGLGGNQAEFTQAYQNMPGYQEALRQGLNAVAGRANAGNMFQSGKTLKDLYRFGSDYENQRYGDYLSRLMGLGQQGLGATQAQVGTQAQGLQNQLATRQSGFQGLTNAAPTIGQGMIAGAQAQQQGLTNLLGMAANGIGSVLGGPGSSLFGGGGGGYPVSNPYGGVPNPTYY